MQAWLAGSLIAAAAAMLWKEQGVTVLAVSAVYDICVVHRMQLYHVLAVVLKVSINIILFCESLPCLNRKTHLPKQEDASCSPYEGK